MGPSVGFWWPRPKAVPCAKFKACSFGARSRSLQCESGWKRSGQNKPHCLHRQTPSQLLNHGWLRQLIQRPCWQNSTKGKARSGKTWESWTTARNETTLLSVWFEIPPDLGVTTACVPSPSTWNQNRTRTIQVNPSWHATPELTCHPLSSLLCEKTDNRTATDLAFVANLQLNKSWTLYFGCFGLYVPISGW